MNRITKFFFVYSFFALTAVLISSVLLMRNLSGTVNKAEAEVTKVRQELERLNSNLSSTGKLIDEVDKIKAELKVAEEATSSVLAASASNSLGYVSVSDSNYKIVNAYKETSFSSENVGKIQSDKAYRYSKKEGSWYLVQISEGLEGWVNGRFIKEIEESSQP